MAARAMAAHRAHIVSYNVLSSHLCAPDHFTRCAAKDLNATTRLERVQAKLEPHIARGAIICLQEVSRPWGGALHVFFQQRGYYFVVSCYGNAFNGYMGVGIAYPCDKYAGYTAERVHVTRVADTLPRPPSSINGTEGGVQAQVSTVANAVDGASALVAGSWKRVVACSRTLAHALEGACRWGVGTATSVAARLGLAGGVDAGASGGSWIAAQAKRDTELWEEARRRHNTCVALRLRPNVRHASAGARPAFWIATYHMPCAFWSPPLMSIHASLVAQHVQQLSAGGGGGTVASPLSPGRSGAGHRLPVVLVGDFNFQPASPQYQLLTSGSIESDHPANPFSSAARSGNAAAVASRGRGDQEPEGWTPDLRFPFASAHAACYGSEPETTNHAAIRNDALFSETLDYIFFSPETIDVEAVESLPTKADLEALGITSLPHGEAEPSDHLLLSATLAIGKTARSRGRRGRGGARGGTRFTPPRDADIVHEGGEEKCDVDGPRRGRPQSKDDGTRRARRSITPTPRRRVAPLGKRST